MLAFARFLLNGFNRFASFLLGIKGAQVTLAVAYISFFTGTAVACYAALVNAIELIAVNINLSGWALNFVLVAIAFLPDNLIEGLSLLLSIELLIFLLRFHSNIFKTKIGQG